MYVSALFLFRKNAVKSSIVEILVQSCRHSVDSRYEEGRSTKQLACLSLLHLHGAIRPRHNCGVNESRVATCLLRARGDTTGSDALGNQSRSADRE